MTDPLEPLRHRIDAIDRQMVDLLVERLRLALDIGQSKQTSGQAFFDPERERRVLERAVEAAGVGFPSGKLQRIFREIIAATRSEQADQLVLVHGEEGGIGHQAAFQRFGRSVRFGCAARAENIFARLTEGSARYAVVSFEGRSLETSLERLDLFLHSDVRVTGEIVVHPRLSLYAQSPDAAEGQVHATAASLAQAARWVEGPGSSRTFQLAGTFAQAIERASASGGALLGYPLCQSLDGWAPVVSGLEDEPEAFRRFHVLGRDAEPPSDHDHTLLLAVLRNRAGALHQITRILAEHRINLSWIEPKPTHLGAWEHLFLLELAGHAGSSPVREALPELSAQVEMLRVLGSYPRESVS